MNTNLKYKLKLTKDAYQKYSEFSFFSDKKLKVEKIENAIVLPPNIKVNPQNALWGSGGVVDENMDYVELSAQKADNSLDNSVRHRLIGKYHIDIENVDYIDEEVFYLNYFAKHWGHFLMDVIGRMWYWIQNPSLKIVYTIPEKSNDKLTGNYLELLNLLGVEKEKLIMIKKPTKFKKVIVAEMSICSCGYYTNEYKDIINRILINVGDLKREEKKIYCSRRLLKNAKKSEIGENIIENIFLNNGYEAYSFERLTVKEQIRLLYSAKEIVIPSGSLQHNLIFAPEDLNVILMMKSPKNVVLQHMVNQIFGGNVCSVDAFLSPLPVTSDGPFWYYINRRFKEFCIDNNIVIPKQKYSLQFQNIVFLVMYLKINWKKILKKNSFLECPYSKKQLIKQYKLSLKQLD